MNIEKRLAEGLDIIKQGQNDLCDLIWKQTELFDSGFKKRLADIENLTKEQLVAKSELERLQDEKRGYKVELTKAPIIRLGAFIASQTIESTVYKAIASTVYLLTEAAAYLIPHIKLRQIRKKIHEKTQQLISLEEKKQAQLTTPKLEQAAKYIEQDFRKSIIIYKEDRDEIFSKRPITREDVDKACKNRKVDQKSQTPIEIDKERLERLKKIYPTINARYITSENYIEDRKIGTYIDIDNDNFSDKIMVLKIDYSKLFKACKTEQDLGYGECVSAIREAINRLSELGYEPLIDSRDKHESDIKLQPYEERVISQIEEITITANKEPSKDYDKSLESTIKEYKKKSANKKFSANENLYQDKLNGIR